MKTEPNPAEPAQPSELQTYQERSLLALLVALGISGPVVATGIYFREGLSPLTWVAVTLSVLVWALLAAFLLGARARVPHWLVYLLITTSAMAIAAHGTTRSMASLVMLAAIVGAGVFLPRRHLGPVAVLAIVLLALLNVLENHGVLPTPNMKTGWAVWLTQTTVLLSLVVTVNVGRRRLIKAYQTQTEALNRARAVERDLRDSQERFQALFRGTPTACMVQSLDTWKVIDVNEAFVALFAHPRDRLLGAKPPHLWARPEEHRAFRAAIDTRGGVSGMRGLAERADGSRFPCLVYAEVTHSGNERLLIATVIDISAEERARHELEQSRDRFSKAFNFSPLGMTITRLSDGKFVEVNPANERVLGWTQADFAGRTALEAGVWLSDAERRNYVQTLRRDGRLQGYETRMRSKSGEPVDVRVWAEIIELDGEPCALSFTLNVAEEKRREAMLLNVAEGVSGETGEAFFRSLAEHLARAIGADGVMVGQVDEQRQLQTLALLWNGALLPNITCSLGQTLCAKSLAQQQLLRFESPHPKRFPLIAPFHDAELRAYIGLPLHDADGSSMGLLTAVWRQQPPPGNDFDALLTIFASRANAELLRLRRDREIRKLQDTLEHQVAARTEQLQYLNRELDAFSYTVSHDLKSPLRAIDGFMHLLREQTSGRLQPDDEDLMQRVDASVARMNSLITDLLSLARVSQGPLQRMEVNLSDLAEDVIRQERHRDPTREVNVQIAPGLMANCDARLAHIVLENLLGNAWKYSRLQSKACIEFGQRPREGQAAPVFYIRDNGAGFDMSRADRLFKPFTRLHSPNEFEGTGIGLATVRRIIERHGGHVRAEGVVGQGSTFEFSFGHAGEQ